ncbi:zinc ribbon domain-containing protein [Dehalococcoides mccartyi]|uniref:FmdB family zinc ribbon protein n=1 Tax=Dehalococcoides mccartyi TaxID=61435 RepID=UPI0003C893A9|nr:zinc ribbon domain-containing protein [Dehalococcoides mccartyi]AHB14233.1 zinc ribbon domain-containing protein [Dehalococcoides mccartyi GY50]AII58580.1 FmdB family transcriptional regulator [Dehalococcoides mccartyi CG1]APH11697.1 FmdB family transcriptional regulator [Dehalococcoides mccartyi]
MAIYEFSCPKCNHVLEINLKVDDRDTPQTCPECKTTGCKRSYSSSVTTRFPGDARPNRSGTKYKTPEKKVIHLSNLNKPR